MDNQWNDWQKYVIQKLDALEDKASRTEITIVKIDSKINGLKSKVATISTFVGTILGTLAHFVAKKLGV